MCVLSTSSPHLAPVARSILVQESSLSPTSRTIVRAMRRVLQRGTAASMSVSGSSPFVASAVSGFIDDGSVSSSCGPPVWTLGVNTELHRTLQRAECGCLGGCESVRGLLKGCAEQNALGSYVAQGWSYHNIRNVFLCSATSTWLHGCSRSLQLPSSVKVSDIPSRDSRSARVVRTPCPECWNHLCHIAKMVHQCDRHHVALHIVVNASEERPTCDDSHPPPMLMWDASLFCKAKARGIHTPEIRFVV